LICPVEWYRLLWNCVIEEEQKDVDSSIENTAREYRDSVKLLADLNKVKEEAT
jgi:hypothetical protein